MEGSRNIHDDDSIADSQVITKVVASVVSGPGSSASIPIIKRIANGQTVVLQTALNTAGQQQQPHHHQQQPQHQDLHQHYPNHSPTASQPPSAIVSQSQLSSSSSSSTTTISIAANNSTNHLPQGVHKSVPTVGAPQSMVTAGSMSIVQFQLPTNQATMVQSVIQPNHQSVIQPPNSLSTIQLPKNVILVNKIAPESVIQSTGSESNIQMIKEENETVNQIFENESKRRLENLARRPSYRKIFNDLSSTEAASSGGTATQQQQQQIEGKNTEEDTEPQQQQQPQQQTSPSQQQTSAALLPNYIKMLPSIQIGSQDGTTIQGIPTIMTNTNTGSSTIVQYATSGHNGQFIVPDLQTYQLRPPNTNAAITQNVVMTSQNIPSNDEALKKREMRLLKNREAAKECRRKKKEYIKCLENRVAVLENQNKALIDELKTLKELYCKKSD